MVNEFLEAAKNSKKEDSSEDRYNRLKKEEAGTEHESMAEKRFKELKEKAKEEFVEKQRQREEEKQQEKEDNDSDFVTY